MSIDDRFSNIMNDIVKNQGVDVQAREDKTLLATIEENNELNSINIPNDNAVTIYLIHEDAKRWAMVEVYNRDEDYCVILKNATIGNSCKLPLVKNGLSKSAAYKKAQKEINKRIDRSFRIKDLLKTWNDED